MTQTFRDAKTAREFAEGAVPIKRIVWGSDLSRNAAGGKGQFPGRGPVALLDLAQHPHVNITDLTRVLSAGMPGGEGPTGYVWHFWREPGNHLARLTLSYAVPVSLEFSILFRCSSPDHWACLRWLAENDGLLPLADAFGWPRALLMVLVGGVGAQQVAAELGCIKTAEAEVRKGEPLTGPEFIMAMFEGKRYLSFPVIAAELFSRLNIPHEGAETLLVLREINGIERVRCGGISPELKRVLQEVVAQGNVDAALLGGFPHLIRLDWVNEVGTRDLERIGRSVRDFFASLQEGQGERTLAHHARAADPAGPLSAARPSVQILCLPACPGDPSLAIGTVQHPATGLFQVWVSGDLGTSFLWVSAHRANDSAREVSAILSRADKKGAFAHTASREPLLQSLAARSDHPIEPVSQELEQHLRDTITRQYERILPTYKASLDIFKAYCRTVNSALAQSTALEIPIGDRLRAIEVGLKKFMAQRRADSLRGVHIRYLDVSALKMAEAVFARDPWLPDFPPATEALWLQPLAPLRYHGAVVKGIALYHLFPPYTGEKPQEEVTGKGLSSDELPAAVLRETERLQDDWWVDIVVDRMVPSKDGEMEVQAGVVLQLGKYNGVNRRWESVPESIEACPTGACILESLGTQQISIPCSSCEQELTWWGCWLKTMFWVMEGKFRKASDSSEFETFTEYLVEDLPPSNPTPDEGKGRQKNRRPQRRQATVEHEYTAMRIAFDASYFKPVCKKKKTDSASRYETHLVLTTEEALREGAMDVDLEGVLIKDWSPVRSYWRMTIGKYKQQIAAKTRRGQLVSLATWKARQKQRSYYDIQKIIASDFREES